MSQEQNTAPDSLSERLDELANQAHGRFVAELRAGGAPLIEDFLRGLPGVARPVVLRALIVAERNWAFENEVSRAGRGFPITRR